MKTFPFAIALALSTGYFALAGPILDPATILNQQMFLQYEAVGQFELQQTGNEITGNYTLSQTPSTQSYLVESGNQIVGEFQLTETNQSGSFELEQSSSNQSLYTLVESGNESVGTYTQDQGNAITGDYQLVEPTSGATTPEPGSLTLAAIGIGCILFSQIGRRSRRKQVQRNLIT